METVENRGTCLFLASGRSARRAAEPAAPDSALDGFVFWAESERSLDGRATSCIRPSERSRPLQQSLCGELDFEWWVDSRMSRRLILVLWTVKVRAICSSAALDAHRAFVCESSNDWPTSCSGSSILALRWVSKRWWNLLWMRTTMPSMRSTSCFINCSCQLLSLKTHLLYRFRCCEYLSYLICNNCLCATEMLLSGLFLVL